MQKTPPPGDADGRSQRHRDHVEGITAALHAVNDTHEVGTDSWRDARDVAVQTYLLDVAGLSLDDLDDRTVAWLDWVVGWDTDVAAGLAAFVDAATTQDQVANP